MRRMLGLMLFALVLAACGGPGDTTIPVPPNAEVVEQTGNTQVDQILTGWRNEVPQQMQAGQVRAETIEEQVYRTNASLDEIATFYDGLTSSGWIEVPGLPGVQDGLLLTGYEIGDGQASLVVGAIDATRLGGTGSVIYTAKGLK